jgi:hypothetical protein
MNYIVGFILLLIGLVFVLCIATDYKKHGGIYHDARPVGKLAETPVVITVYIMTGAILLGAVYLLMPSQCMIP